MTDVLEQIMLWTFWVGLGIVLAIDIVLVLIARKKSFSRNAKVSGKDMPATAYAVGLLPTHWYFNYPIVPGWVGLIIVLGVAVVFLIAREWGPRKWRPVVACLVGMVVGFLFTSS